MAVSLEQAPEQTRNEALFERTLGVCKYYASDPQTLWGSSIESFPVVVDCPELEAYDVLLSGDLSVEYAVGGRYKTASANLKVGMTEAFMAPIAQEENSQWDKSYMISALGSYAVMTEVFDDGVADRRAIVARRSPGHRLKANHVDLLSDSDDIKALPHGKRLLAMCMQVATQRPAWVEVDRSRSQSRTDHAAIKSFMGLAGFGTIRVTSSVPFTDGREVVLEQAHHLRNPDAPGVYALSTPAGLLKSEVTIKVDDYEKYTQTETHDGIKTMTVGKEDALEEIIEQLELGSWALPMWAKRSINKPSSQTHARKHLDLIQPLAQA